MKMRAVIALALLGSMPSMPAGAQNGAIRVAGTAAGAGMAQSALEVERFYERYANRADEQDISWCRSMIPADVVAGENQVAPSQSLRERYIAQVRAMGTNGLKLEERRLENLIQMMREGSDVGGGYSLAELRAQNELVGEALTLIEEGGRLDPANNHYRRYIDANQDGSQRYKLAMADCLRRRVPEPGAEPVAATKPERPPAEPPPRAPQRDRVISTMPDTPRIHARAPDSAGRIVPGASAVQINACERKLPPQLSADYRAMDQVYLDRQRYVNSVAAMDEAALDVERTKLSRMLDLMKDHPHEQDYSKANTLSDVIGRYQLVIQAQEALFEGSGLDSASNKYNAFVNAADRERQSIASQIQTQIANCAEKAMKAPGGSATVSQGGVAAWMTGTFDSGGGVMQFSPGGGTYEYQNGRMSVTRIEGTVVEGRWEQKLSAGQCPDGGYWGRFRLNFTETGFSGVFGYCDEEPHRIGGFQGKRRK